LVDRRTIRKRRLALWGGVALAGLAVVALSPWAGLAIVAIALIMLAQRRGVPILVYHSVSSDPGWLPWGHNISVRPEVFAAQMEHLAASRWRVVPTQAVFLGETDHRSVALHFDDAYRDFAVAAGVLRKHALPATVFASSDFIDPSIGPRPVDDAPGYLNADELRAFDAEPLFNVDCHGQDHARVAVSDRTTPRDPNRWGPETAYLWSLLPGDKSRWFETEPPGVAHVPETESALIAAAVTDAGLESDKARDARVTQSLTEARTALTAVLGRPVTFLCWPFDRVTPHALASARAAGFTQFTAGRADNPIGKRTDILSRTHINDRAAGGGPIWLEVLVFRARLEVAAGNLLFLPVTALAARLRARRFSILHGPDAGATA
jgi:hypothetical protein